MDLVSLARILIHCGSAWARKMSSNKSLDKNRGLPLNFSSGSIVFQHPNLSNYCSQRKSDTGGSAKIWTHSVFSAQRNKHFRASNTSHWRCQSKAEDALYKKKRPLGSKKEISTAYKPFTAGVIQLEPMSLDSLHSRKVVQITTILYYTTS